MGVLNVVVPMSTGHIHSGLLRVAENVIGVCVRQLSWILSGISITEYLPLVPANLSLDCKSRHDTKGQMLNPDVSNSY